VDLAVSRPYAIHGIHVHLQGKKGLELEATRNVGQFSFAFCSDIGRSDEYQIPRESVELQARWPQNSMGMEYSL
jgi:hypothetical protein